MNDIRSWVIHQYPSSVLWKSHTSIVGPSLNDNEEVSVIESEPNQAQIDEILNMLEHVFLGFVFYSTANVKDECADLLRKHGRLTKGNNNV